MRKSAAGASLAFLLCTAQSCLAITTSSTAGTQTQQYDRPAKYSANVHDYKVKTIDEILLTDQQRSKHVPVTVSFPDGQGPFPVIIFSHGAGGSPQSYQPLIRYWTANGYVCLQPSHNDSLQLRQRTGQDATFMTILRQAASDWQGWENRARDISLIIDRLTEISQNSPLLQGKMNFQKIGVAGHSYGAFTAQLIGGATIDIPRGGKDVSFSDPRAQAILLLSPQGRSKNTLGFKNQQSWSQCLQPEMIMTGSLDKGMLGQPPSWRTEGYHFAPPGNKYLVFIQGASHLTFTGKPGAEQDLSWWQQLQASGTSTAKSSLMRKRWLKNSGYGGPPPSNNQHPAKLPEIDTEPPFDYVKMSSLAFWDAYLKDDSAALSYLHSDSLAKRSHNTASIESK